MKIRIPANDERARDFLMLGFAKVGIPVRQIQISEYLYEKYFIEFEINETFIVDKDSEGKNENSNINQKI